VPNGILIAVGVVLIVAAAVISHFLTVSNLKQNAESKIGNAETKAREIIDDAVKTAEAKKKESFPDSLQSEAECRVQDWECGDKSKGNH